MSEKCHFAPVGKNDLGPEMGYGTGKCINLPMTNQSIKGFKGAVGQTMIHALDSRYFVISILPVRPLANQI